MPSHDSEGLAPRVSTRLREVGERSETDGSSPHLGTPDTISDDEGNVAQQEYGPFGDLQGNPAFINLFGTHLGFTGQQQDFDLGLTDMHGRVFDPLAARFTTADPIMQAPYFSQGQNRYAYALNDPINLTDPSGMAFDTSGDLFAQGHLVGDSMTAGFAGGVGAGIAYGIGSGIADSGASLASVSPGSLAGTAGVGIGVANLVSDVSSLFSNTPDHSGEGSRIVHAPSAAPRSNAFKSRAPHAAHVNKGGPPVQKPAGEPACNQDCVNAPYAGGFRPVPHKVFNEAARQVPDTSETLKAGMGIIMLFNPFGLEELGMVGGAKAAGAIGRAIVGRKRRVLR